MSAFHLFQRVRIVRASNYPEFIGKEGVVVDTDPHHPDPLCDFLMDFVARVRPDGADGNYLAQAGDIEPLKHDPDAEDLATQENAGNFDCPLPEHARPLAIWWP